ncbi:MAG: dTDP-glucose 4,6-dehydratase [Candidatus Micrarchaeaceae archaeon]
MKILITGGAGFVGSHLCEKYTTNGDTVICLDNMINGDLGNVRHLVSRRNFKFVKGDIRDPELLEKLARDADVIMHLAAQIHVDRSVVEPKLTYETNVIGTLNVMEAARVWDVKRVIYASTSEVYGPAEFAPMHEAHPLNPPHPYGASKVGAEKLASAYIKTYGMDIAIMRPFNIFGQKQKDTGYGGAISIFVKRVLGNQPPIIYGSGKQTRDYTYVKDTVAAYDAVLNHKKPINEPINFGTGKEVSITDLANLIIKLCGKEGKLKPVHVDERPGEVSRLVADASKAKKLLGWEAKYSLEDGLTEFIDWYKNYKSEEWTKFG